MTDPAGPNVSLPPLYQVGRIPSASSSALMPPSEKPPVPAPPGEPPGYVESPSMSSRVSPASATAFFTAVTASASGGIMSRRPICDMPIPVIATRSSNLSVWTIGRIRRA